MITFSILMRNIAMSNIFQSKKLVKDMSQAPNFGSLLCRIMERITSGALIL